MAFEHSIEIAARPEDLFTLTQDYSRRLEWDPFLRSADLVGDASTSGIGVRAYCVSRSGLGMETEYIAFSPPHVVAVKMTRGPWFIESFAGSWRFEEVTPGHTRVRFRYHFRIRPRRLSGLLMSVMVGVFAHDTRKRLMALKAAVEQKGLLSGANSSA